MQDKELLDGFEIIGHRYRLSIEGVPTYIHALSKAHGGEALFFYYIGKPCPTHGLDLLLFDIRKLALINQKQWIDQFKAVEGKYPRSSRLLQVRRLLIARDRSSHDVFRTVFCAQW
jgi:hypothetical protein